MTTDRDNQPTYSEFATEEYLPIPAWLRTPGSPLRFAETLWGDRRTAVGPQYRLTCEACPQFFTTGVRSWVLRYAELHAADHGVVAPEPTIDLLAALEGQRLANQ